MLPVEKVEQKALGLLQLVEVLMPKQFFKEKKQKFSLLATRCNTSSKILVDYVSNPIRTFFMVTIHARKTEYLQLSIKQINFELCKSWTYLFVLVLTKSRRP